MITNFKIFEYSGRKYIVDEYIKVTNKYFTNKQLTLAKIIEVDPSSMPYLVVFSNSEKFWIDDDMIVRKLTPEEIEQYELELSSNKYNL